MPQIIPTNPGQSSSANPQSSSGGSARDRAIAALIGNAPSAQPQNSQETPVSNPSQVSPEEMTALSTNKSESEKPAEGQKADSEGVSDEVTKPSEATKSTKEETPLSAQYAQLARKEKAIRAEMQKLKAEREAFKAERESATAAKSQPQVDQSQFIPKERLTKETWAVLNELGISYEQLTQAALNGPSPEAQAQQSYIAKLEAKLSALEEKQNSTQKSIEESQQRGYQQALNQIRNEAKKLVASLPDDYEAIQASGSVDDVVDLIEKTFNEDGILLTVEEAAKAVEEHLAEEAMKYAKLKKIQQRLQPVKEPAAPMKQETVQKSPAPKTLTNAQSASRQLSARERAMLAFKGELKS